MLGLSLMASAQSLVPGNPKAGKAKSSVCAACHGADGNSTNAQFPKLAGQNATYIVKELQDYKSGARKNPIMSVQAKGLSKQDMQDIAVYFASQRIKIGETDPKLVKTGRRVYLGGDIDSGAPACAACHSPTGQGNAAAVYPALRGQHAAYIVAQLKEFASGKRDNSPKKMMSYVASHLDAKQMKAVASYVQGLHAASGG
jgi:cytochrome c553